MPAYLTEPFLGRSLRFSCHVHAFMERWQEKKSHVTRYDLYRGKTKSSDDGGWTGRWCAQDE